MADAAPDWLDLLLDRPDEAFWVGVEGVGTRGALHAAVIEEAGRWSGDRLALDAAPTLATVVSLLGGLAAGASILLVPRRETPAVREHLVACAGASSGMPPRGAPDDQIPASVWVRSSGSFGNPRWIIHTPESLLAGARAAAEHLDFGPGDRWRLSLPLDHVGGLSLIFRALCSGGAVMTAPAEVIVAPGETHRSLVATQLRRLLADGHDANLRNLRCLLLGGGPIPEVLRREALDAGLPLVVSYGLSETAAVLTASSLNDDPDLLTHPHYAGRPLITGAVADDDGSLLVRGPALCRFIAGNDGVAIPPPLDNGWLATGDLGRLDGDRLFVTGRRDNVIVSGGEKLPAEEVEAALLELDGVEETVVVPVEHEEFGQRPVAFVTWRDGHARELAAVREELADTLATWKHPVAIWPLPTVDGLKPDRAALRRWAAELGRPTGP